jgi:RNA polymerase sigma factor (TIGR02999 family)
VRSYPLTKVRGKSANNRTFRLHGDSSFSVTELLGKWRAGDADALSRLLPVVYQELRRVAGSYLRRERSDHTLQSTALVHEAYLRLAGPNAPEWRNRAHFFGVAANLMRQILVEHARARHAEKRGGHAVKLSLDEASDVPMAVDVDVLALDEAMQQLAQMDARQAQIVELRFFGGLSVEGSAEVLGISPATVKRDWTSARAWLYREMSE